MLKGLDPLLGPELLAMLRAMGHGDEIAIVDGNYPAQAHGRRVVRADGHGVLAVIDAILSVMPLDDGVDHAVFLPDPPHRQPIHAEMTAQIARHDAAARPFALRGEAFYDRVRAAHGLVATSEPALYANVVLRKGVIRPEQGR